MGEIINAVHLCIDMQNVFAKGGVWETPWMEKVLPVIADIAARYSEWTIFTRFITPERPEDRAGQWQAYFAKWRCATRSELRPGDLEIVPPLARYSPPAESVLYVVPARPSDCVAQHVAWHQGRPRCRLPSSARRAEKRCALLPRMLARRSSAPAARTWLHSAPPRSMRKTFPFSMWKSSRMARRVS